jgi:hypothetical protein
MKGLSRGEAAAVKERLVSEIGLPHFQIVNSLYSIDGETVNVKVTSRRSTGRYWFNIQRKRVNSYIWICYDPQMQTWEAYYWIPAAEMWNYVKRGSYKDRTWESRGRSIANFEIDSERDLYIGGEKARLSISKYRNLSRPP